MTEEEFTRRVGMGTSRKGREGGESGRAAGRCRVLVLLVRVEVVVVGRRRRRGRRGRRRERIHVRGPCVSPGGGRRRGRK